MKEDFHIRLNEKIEPSIRVSISIDVDENCSTIKHASGAYLAAMDLKRYLAYQAYFVAHKLSEALNEEEKRPGEPGR